jgi:transposase
MTEKNPESDFLKPRPNAAGIDIGSKFHMVAVPPGSHPEPVRCFAADTQSLKDMVKYLKEAGVTSVAMEATGVYWVAPFNLLAAHGLDPCLLDPRKTKAIPGRKSDVKDCQWLQILFSLGLVSPVFMPDEHFVGLRELNRQRLSIIEDMTAQSNRMEKALRLMNINVGLAVSDTMGETGTRIVKAVLRGVRDPRKLAALRDSRCKLSEELMARHLDGVATDHHLHGLRLAFDSYNHFQAQLLDTEKKILALLKTMPSRKREEAKAGGEDPGGKVPPEEAAKPVPPEEAAKAAPARKASKAVPARKAAKAVPAREAWDDPGLSLRRRRELVMVEIGKEVARVLGVDLTKVEGVSVGTALAFAAEVGPDLDSFPTAARFASWLGLCPACNISGGKKLSSRTRKVNSRLATMLRLCALGLTRSRSSLGSFFRKMRARQGPQMAITTTAHKLARLLYSLVKHGEEYAAVSLRAAAASQREYEIRAFMKKARRLELGVFDRNGEVIQDVCQQEAEEAVA